MTYPATPGWKARDTSLNAAIGIEPKAQVLRERVRTILSVYELTADEVAAKLDESILAIRPRVTELSKQGIIRDTGMRRKNLSGRPAIVWGIADKQGALF